MPQDFSPALHTLFEVPCHNQKLCSQELDRYDSFQHLSMQLLNPNLTSGINTHWHLGQIHILFYKKIGQISVLKELLWKGGTEIIQQRAWSKEISTHQCDPGRDWCRGSLWNSLYLPGAKEQFPCRLHILNHLQSPPCVNFRVVQSKLYLRYFTRERKKEKSNKINNKKLSSLSYLCSFQKIIHY